MILSRITPAQVFNIRNPIWNGGARKVGLASHKLGTHNEINILTRNKEGERIYPLPFYASDKQAQECNVMTVKGGVKLYLIPINELELLERE